MKQTCNVCVKIIHVLYMQTGDMHAYDGNGQLHGQYI